MRTALAAPNGARDGGDAARIQGRGHRLRARERGDPEGDPATTMPTATTEMALAKANVNVIGKGAGTGTE